MVALYTHNNKDITEQDFLRAFGELGIHAGDTVFVHSDISVFGKLALPDKEVFLQKLCNLFFTAVGETGTVAMPTFSYSFGSEGNGVFDADQSKSTVGSLTEFFRHLPGVKRSLQPMLSAAARGPRAAELLAVGKDSFGRGTVFENLRTLDATIVLFGVTMNACTFLHHIEQIYGVSYRSMKTFTGTVVHGGERHEDSCTYFARPLDGSAENDFSRIEPRLRESGILRETAIGASTISAISARALFDEGMRYLTADPSGMLQSTV